MNIPPDATLMANVCLVGMMIWKRCRSWCIWTIQAPVIVGTLFLKWNDWRYDAGLLSGHAYNARLHISHNIQHAFEFAALVCIFRSARRQESPAFSDLLLMMAAVMHLLASVQWTLEVFPGIDMRSIMLLQRDFWNAFLIAAMLFAVWFSQEEHYGN